MTGASHYWLYVADAATGQAAINTNSISGTSFTATSGLTPGRGYLWYIGAVSTNGAGYTFSGPRSFSLAALTAAPVPTGMSGTIPVSPGYDQPTFNWSAVLGANHYWLYLVDDTTNTVAVNNNTIGGTSFKITSRLTPGHTYTWYIAAVSTNGGIDVFSGPTNFTLATS